MKIKCLVFLLLFFSLFTIPSALSIKNPAAVYCKELGYEYKTEHIAEGDVGYCSINESLSFNAWDFFTGKVGKEYSYCSKLGYDTITLEDGKNPYTPYYGACILPITKSNSEPTPLTEQKVRATSDTKTVSIVDLMGLKDKVESKSDAQPKVMVTPVVSKEKAAAQSTPLPSSFDWRNYEGYNWMTSTKDQGLCGSCWAFSAVGAVESNYRIEQKLPSLNIDLSEQYLVSDCSDAGDCDGGLDSRALEYIRTDGITDEDCFPYSWTGLFGKHCSDRCSDWYNRLYKIYSWREVALTRSEIKKALINEGPLSVTIYVDGYFDLNGVYKCDEANPAGLHAVDLVGYNDEGQYWIIKNSWGLLGDLLQGTKIGYGECGLENLEVLSVRAMEPECQYDSDCNYLDNSYCVVETSGNNNMYAYHEEGICSNYECKSSISSVENCDDGLYCSGKETCYNGTCKAGNKINCSQYDTSEVATCNDTSDNNSTFNYDNNPLTWDYRPFTPSQCIEPSGCSVVIGAWFITHTCDIERCGAECKQGVNCSDTDCGYLDGCVGKNYYDYHDMLNNCTNCKCENNSCRDSTVNINDSRCWDYKVISPEGKVYNKRSINLNVESREQTQEILYSLNEGRFTRLCKECNSSNKSKSFPEGDNHLVVRFLSLDNNRDIELNFTIDSTKPRISSTEPRRGYTNGEFTIKYTEENCDTLAIETTSPTHNVSSAVACTSGRNIEKTLVQNLSSFEGETIQYTIRVTDIAGNTDSETIKNLKVDTTPPQVIKHEFKTEGRYLYTNITLSEKASIYYIDYGDKIPTERTLCSRCNEYNKKKYFNKGSHNITIFAEDDADNRAIIAKNIVFVAV